MAYDLKKVKAPHLMGFALRLLTSCAESRLLSKVIAPRLLKDVGITHFRSLEIEGPPTFFPWIEPQPQEQAEAIDLKKLQEHHLNPQGFQFRRVYDFIQAYQNQECTPLDVAQRLIQKIEESNTQKIPLGGMVQWNKEEILRQAEASTARWKAGTPRYLEGVPVAVKDELDQKGFPTHVGSKILAKGPALEDATVVARLRQEGALLIGKANMHEIGIGVTGNNFHWGTPRNPYHLGHYTGGSSSGPGCVVAAGLCPIAVGADGGGSIRIPSAFCGIFGLKATFGRVSEQGAAPLCWSVAHIGPMSASAADCALMYAIMAGPDPKDPFTLRQAPLELSGINTPHLQNIRIGVYSPWFEDASPEIVKACQQQVEYFQSLGAVVVPIEIPHLDTMRLSHLITIASEMAASMEKPYKEGYRRFGYDVRLNLALARLFNSRDYVRAQQMRTQAIQIFEKLFHQVDVIVTPTTGITAPPIPPKALAGGESDITTLTEIMRFIIPGNFCGNPAISFPVGYDSQGLPIGMQGIGRPWEEALLLRLASLAENHLERRKPQLYYDLLANPSFKIS
jgi:Asp-tRNA(Asn)/Glu-tRNA(Gln) amidotransferase A subunit family amidase